MSQPANKAPQMPLQPDTLLPYVVTLRYELEPFSSKQYRVRVMTLADADPTKSAFFAGRALEEWLDKKDGEEYPRVVKGEDCASAVCITREDYIKTWKEMRNHSPLAAWFRPEHAFNRNMMPKAFCELKKTDDGLKAI